MIKLREKLSIAGCIGERLRRLSVLIGANVVLVTTLIDGVLELEKDRVDVAILDLIWDLELSLNF